MARCVHSFSIIKSDTNLMIWTCSLCHVGPHWYIYECAYCKLKVCQGCTSKA